VCIVQSDTRPSRKCLSWRDCCWVLTSNSLRQNKLTTSLVYTHLAPGVTVVGPRCRLDPKFEIGSVDRCRLQCKKCLSTVRRNSSTRVVNSPFNPRHTVSRRPAFQKGICQRHVPFGMHRSQSVSCTVLFFQGSASAAL
jgi:hypothetical protein